MCAILSIIEKQYKSTLASVWMFYSLWKTQTSKMAAEAAPSCDDLFNHYAFWTKHSVLCHHSSQMEKEIDCEQMTVADHVADHAANKHNMAGANIVLR